ncbi:3'-5' exoribonuclease HELZ2 isoform X2 [Hemitrygon akajei]|uniref:3'-5' exoribonuclease HELZ2 isoform X2 n=1 Tax=Hemitrygon akajei TaxID=2704970 RepID=UPI003BFA23AC
MKGVEDLFKELDLQLICLQCSEPTNESSVVLKNVNHECQHLQLVARKPQSVWKIIRRRPTFINPVRYEVCWFYKEGTGCKKHRNNCTFAWSKEEALVWNYEKDNKTKRSTLKNLVAKRANNIKLCSNTPSAKQQRAEETIVNEFEGLFVEICKVCFYKAPQQIAVQNSNGLCSLSPQHNWKPLLVHILAGANDMKQCNEIKSLPSGDKIQYCDKVTRGLFCLHDDCNFAHSEVELMVWISEVQQGLKRPTLLQVSQQRIMNGQPGAVQMIEDKVNFYCRVCLITFSSQDGFESHCSSIEHVQMVKTDTTVEWKHRKPPLKGKNNYQMCPRVDICEFGENCIHAHSHEELEEWLMRTEVGQNRKKTAKNQGLISFRDSFLEEYRNCRNEILIVSTEINGINISCDRDLRVHHYNKKNKLKWNFQIQSQKALLNVALLKREPGATFSLEGGSLPKNCLSAEGKKFQLSRTLYSIVVSFEAVNIGIYEQWVVFDFGNRPLLVRKIHIGTEDVTQISNNGTSDFQFVSLERWNSGNRRIIPCMERNEQEHDVLQKYKSPSIALEHNTKDMSKTPITRTNYKEKMHSFLYQEEQAEADIVSRLNLQVTISITDTLEETTEGMKFAPPGELFAVVPMPPALTNSNEGYLFKRAVKTALLAPNPSSNNDVYEAAIIQVATTESRIALKLSQRCITSLGYHKGHHCNVEIHFQLDRLAFCFRHQAVDRLSLEQIIFPDFTNCCIPQCSQAIPIGNQKQCDAMTFITGQCHGNKIVPPLLIYGPFGTGKTFTLAKAAMEIVKRPDTRLLLCTDTNSAADLYVKDYFHQYATEFPEGRPLRLKYVKKDPIHTDPITLKYCLLSNNSFAAPDKCTLESYRIVITTCMEAKLFSELSLPPGFFTHILIDEAAQMLECDALIPLGIAGNETRIVLAGDHMQVTPKLFSVEDNEMADYTLLNRLFQYYMREKHEKAAKSRIIFKENYRSVKEIIDFVSVQFYVGKVDVIQASGDVQRHPKFYPLMFRHVPGTSRFHPSTLSWYNEHEVLQVIEMVESIMKSWPSEWGKPNQMEICVVSSEFHQIRCLRQELRLHGCKDVHVENVFNIQGKQFRVIIISTVHTRESSISSKGAGLEFFSQPRVLNTAMTRAQSLVIVVGNALALCSFGNCRKIWKKYIQESIDNESIYPEDLSMEQIKQAIDDTEYWAPRDEDESDSDSEKGLDPILQELLDESKNVTLTLTEEGFVDFVTGEVNEQERTSSEVSFQSSQKRNNVQYTDYPKEVLQTLLLTDPYKYKQCEIVMEKFYKGYAIVLDDPQAIHIKIEGRANCGKSFPGDQVLVEVLSLRSEEGDIPDVSGKVVGVLKTGDLPRTFVCRVDEYDSQVMVPINKCVTKIYTPWYKRICNKIPIRKANKDRCYETVKTINLTEEIRRDKFFVVEIICWRESFYLPLGIVTKVLPAAVTMDRGMEVLNLEYQVNDSFPNEIIKELKLLSQESKQLNDNRKDCRNYFTFTVDPVDSKDLDDAISVRDLDEYYEIGVHITDVTSFVPKGSFLDAEAQRRGLTYYPPTGDPIHMLPPKLSQKLCSLLPGKDRKVISLFVQVQKSTDIVVKANFSLSDIQSNRKLTYEEAEDIIEHFSGSELRFGTLEDSVAVAFHFARIHRKYRLQDGYYYEKPDEHRQLGKRRSHQMIEELMIMMNSFVAEFLTNKMKTMNVTPVRCQGAPAHQQMVNLKQKYKDLVCLSIHLPHLMAAGPSSQSPSFNEFQILTSLWDCLIKAAKDTEIHKLIDFIATDDIHPNLAPISLELRKLMLKAFTIRSNSTLLSKQGHYSLHVESYTWATSPIRRYLDIVIQRLLTQVLRKVDIQYTRQEIDKFCIDFNRKKRKASSYEKIADSLYLATQLQNQALKKLAFAVNVEPLSRHFGVLFALNSDALSEAHCINYRTLQLVDQPAFNEESKTMKLMWRKRIYSLETSRKTFLPPGQFRNPYVRRINSSTWQELLKAVKSDEFSKVAALVLEENKRRQSDVMKEHFGKIEVSKGQPSHYVTISMEVKNGEVLQIQLTKGINNGFLVPAVQLFSVTPMFEICVEHAENPVTCFSEYASQSTQKNYKDIKAYQAVWGPLCAMESASSAVAENEVIVIYGVKIAWKNKNMHGKILYGSFAIPKENCKNWAIESALAKCYLCLRCRCLKQNVANDLTKNEEPLYQIMKKPDAPENSSELNIDPTSYTWVAHAVTNVFSNDGLKSDREPNLRTDFTVHQIPMDTIPKEIFQEDTRFIVEIIPKQLPEIRKEEAVRKLADASPLAQSIALAQQIPIRRLQKNKQKCYNIPGLPNLNPSQENAVRCALQSPFTLIQGPPGTGKTMVGVHIVYWFHKMNLKLNPSPGPAEPDGHNKNYILYCGPSNKSVNVVAEYLLELKTELKPLRVYSEQVEIMDFPYQGSNLLISKRSMREAKPKPELKPITLHYRIRQPSNPHASRIKEFDAKFQTEAEVTEDEIREYKKLLDTARNYELKCHDVILCTCATSSSKTLQKLRMRQILVDESAMCTEPELLIPIVAHNKAEQIVLLGDHMQLRPIISNEFCRRLGMETSLFERYERYVQHGLLLDVQYRMHQEICQFPSDKFYGGKLKTDKRIASRPRSFFCHAGKCHCPIIFGHMVGNEISLMVSTEEGNENSRANKPEAEKAVHIVHQLLLNDIKPSDIAVLTPYNAQVIEISKLFKAKGIKGVTVCTIVKSQGSEWRYVIFSVVRSLLKKDIDTQPSKSWLKQHLGFITDPNQVNVALTRAKEGLCILGNEHLLSCSYLWKDLLAHYKRKNSFVDAEQIYVRR